VCGEVWQWFRNNHLRKKTLKAGRQNPSAQIGKPCVADKEKGEIQEKRENQKEAKRMNAPYVLAINRDGGHPEGIRLARIASGGNWVKKSLQGCLGFWGTNLPLMT